MALKGRRRLILLRNQTDKFKKWPGTIGRIGLPRTSTADYPFFLSVLFLFLFCAYRSFVAFGSSG